MSDPPTREAYDKAFSAAQKVSGFGMNVTQHFPCPFCAAPDWNVVRILALEEQSGEPKECKACKRVSKFVITRTGESTSIRIVQVSGDDPPPYLEGMSTRE